MPMGKSTSGNTPIKVRSLMLSPSVARGIAIWCAAVFVASAHTAPAGINVRTGYGPGVGTITALVIDSIPVELFQTVESCSISSIRWVRSGCTKLIVGAGIR